MIKPLLSFAGIVLIILAAFVYQKPQYARLEVSSDTTVHELIITSKKPVNAFEVVVESDSTITDVMPVGLCELIVINELSNDRRQLHYGCGSPTPLLEEGVALRITTEEPAAALRITSLTLYQHDGRGTPLRQK